jgi:hypothetical protein
MSSTHRGFLMPQTPPKPFTPKTGSNASPKPAKQAKPVKIRAPKLNKGR